MADTNHTTCAVEHCDRSVKTRGWCERHYMNWRNSGDPLAWSELDIGGMLRRRGWTVTDPGCWEWNGTIANNGYGVFTAKHLGIRSGLVHRYSYEYFKEPIPEGLLIRHKCDNPKCMNPDHLETGTYADNTRDMLERDRAAYWFKRTMCRNGHDLSDPDNDGTRMANGKLRHYCKQCEAENRARWNASEREKRAANPAPEKTHCPKGHAYTEDNIYWHKGSRNCRTCRKIARAKAYARSKGES